MARDSDRPLAGRAAPDIVSRSVSDALTAVLDQMPLELAQRHHGPEYPARSAVAVPYSAWSCTSSSSPTKKAGCARPSKSPGVITCAPTLDGARLLVRDALDEWLQALTSAERATIGADATRETLTLSVA